MSAAPNDTGTVPNLASPERPLGPGDSVDRYRIDHMIAAGGMARVYRATHAFTGRTVALKVLRTRYLRRPDLIERFQKEAMALSQIRHSNVVTIENGGLTDKGEVFIAMELLDGHTLRDILVERGQLPIGEALSILIQIALGVAAAHEVNVVHRDLKPENIFCTSDGAVKVLDLGLAKFIGYDAKETDPAKTGMIGTAAYIAPERLDGLPIDARCDIYALGLIAYECLAGFHPLVPDGVWPSSEEIALRQLTFDPPVLRQLPSEIWAMIARATHKDRERRFASMNELAAVLHRIARSLGGDAADPARASADAAPRAGAAPRSATVKSAKSARRSAAAAKSAPRFVTAAESAPGSALRTSPTATSNASVRSLEGQVVSRAAASGVGAAKPAAAFVETVLRYPVITGAVIGLVGAFGLFFWKRAHRAVPGASAPMAAVAPRASAPTPASARSAAPDVVSAGASSFVGSVRPPAVVLPAVAPASTAPGTASPAPTGTGSAPAAAGTPAIAVDATPKSAPAPAAAATATPTASARSVGAPAAAAPSSSAKPSSVKPSSSAKPSKLVLPSSGL